MRERISEDNNKLPCGTQRGSPGGTPTSPVDAEEEFFLLRPSPEKRSGRARRPILGTCAREGNAKGRRARSYRHERLQVARRTAAIAAGQSEGNANTVPQPARHAGGGAPRRQHPGPLTPARRGTSARSRSASIRRRRRRFRYTARPASLATGTAARPSPALRLPGPADSVAAVGPLRAVPIQQGPGRRCSAYLLHFSAFSDTPHSLQPSSLA